MTAWRPVRGSITRLDLDLTSEEDIQALFEDERILGRGALDSENSAVFEFEVAIAGRRRRVATLDESGEIIKGRSLENFAQHLHESLRKVEVNMLGTVLLGPMDIGAVDVDDTSLAYVPGVSEGDGEHDRSERESADLSGVADVLGESGTRADSGTPSTALLPPGHAFALADLATSEIPVIATAQNQTIGSMPVGGVRLLVADSAPKVQGTVLVHPDYSLVFTRSDDDVKPLLTLTRMGRSMEWDWSGELPQLEWIGRAGKSPAVSGTVSGSPVDSESAQFALNAQFVHKASEFVRSELGAGGVARVAVADMVDVTFESVREALLIPPAQAQQALISALGLPCEVLAVVEGAATIADIPGIRLFEPRGAASAFTEALAWEVAGEGRVNADVADAYRMAYLKRPWVISMLSAVQTAVGGAIVATAMRPSAGEKRSAWKTCAGAFLVLNGISRIATTQYVNSAFQRFVGDVES